MDMSMLEELSKIFPEKRLLSVEDITNALECDEKTVQNWVKRPEPHRRPPRLIVGKTVRFLREPFISWFAQEQLRYGE